MSPNQYLVLKLFYACALRVEVLCTFTSAHELRKNCTICQMIIGSSNCLMKQVVSFLLMLFNTSIPWSVVWPQWWGPNAIFFNPAWKMQNFVQSVKVFIFFFKLFLQTQQTVCFGCTCVISFYLDFFFQL